MTEGNTQKSPLDDALENVENDTMALIETAMDMFPDEPVEFFIIPLMKNCIKIMAAGRSLALDVDSSNIDYFDKHLTEVFNSAVATIKEVSNTAHAKRLKSQEDGVNPSDETDSNK